MVKSFASSQQLNFEDFTDMDNRRRKASKINKPGRLRKNPYRRAKVQARMRIQKFFLTVNSKVYIPFHNDGIPQVHVSKNGNTTTYATDAKALMVQKERAEVPKLTLLTVDDANENGAHLEVPDTKSATPQEANAEVYFDLLEAEDLDFLANDMKEIIGCGGYGQVFKIQYKSQVAVLKEATDSCCSVSSSFENEKDILLHLNGAGGSPRLFAFCPDPAAIIMEYIPGRTFEQHVWDGCVSDYDKLRLLPEIGRQLQQVHEKGIIHVDFKGDNVMIDMHDDSTKYDFPEVRIIDYGMAAKTGHFTCINGLHNEWFAPEYLYGTGATTAGDVYSFGDLIADTLKHLEKTPPSSFWEIVFVTFTHVPENRPSLGEVIERLDEAVEAMRENLNESSQKNIIYF